MGGCGSYRVYRVHIYKKLNHAVLSWICMRETEEASPSCASLSFVRTGMLAGENVGVTVELL